MAQTGRIPAAGTTLIMMTALVRAVPAFLVKTSLPRPACFTNGRGACLAAGQGFGDTPKPAQKPSEPAKDNKGPRKARSLMPLADEAASKLLAKEGTDGSVKFNNPAVGDFQVLDALVEYPGSFELKIIGVNDDTFVSDIREAVAGCLTNGVDNVIKCSTREKGKYTSITLKVHVNNSTQLYKCYEVINQDKRVKFKF
ncbi:unnamed protein product [Hapterophycus canaliculatus]